MIRKLRRSYRAREQRRDHASVVENREDTLPHCLVHRNNLSKYTAIRIDDVRIYLSCSAKAAIIIHTLCRSYIIVP